VGTREGIYRLNDWMTPVMDEDHSVAALIDSAREVQVLTFSSSVQKREVVGTGTDTDSRPTILKRRKAVIRRMMYWNTIM